MEWFLIYLVLTSDQNRNWIVAKKQQQMTSQIVCERTAAKLPQMATLRRQFMNIRCEQLPIDEVNPPS